jgi:hypothetical protein
LGDTRDKLNKGLSQRAAKGPQVALRRPEPLHWVSTLDAGSRKSKVSHEAASHEAASYEAAGNKHQARARLRFTRIPGQLFLSSLRFLESFFST